MKTNLEIYKTISKLPNFLLNNVYHIGSDFNSDDFYQFASALDEADLGILGIDITHSDLFKCVKSKSQHDLIIKKQKFGWLLEVYFPHVLGEIRDKKGILAGYEFSNKNSHSTLIYAEDYEAAIDQAVKISKEFLKDDLAKAKKK